MRRDDGGFTLLEVMVAISILGLALTVILSAQVGLFSSAERAQNLTFATNLARCKMTELEADVLKKGFQLTDVIEDGPCCEDEPDRKYECRWRIETVELPELAEVVDEDGDSEDTASSSGVLGKMLDLKSEAQEGNLDLASGSALGEIGDYFGGEDSEAGMQSLASSLMAMVYPNLKPMLEASVRRATVTVAWNEGSRERELVVVEFLTNPMQGLDPLADEQLRAMELMGDEAEVAADAPATEEGTK